MQDMAGAPPKERKGLKMGLPMFRADDVALRRLLLPVYVILVALCALSAVLTPMDSLQFPATAAFGVAAVLALLLTVFTRVSAAAVLATIGFFGIWMCITCDIALAAQIDSRWWPAVLLVLDVYLVGGSQGWIIHMSVVIVFLYLALERTESHLRFGLYEVAHFNDLDVPICSCASPPCGLSIGRAISSFFAWLAILIVDFGLTRRYAYSLRDQLTEMKAVVQVAESVAQRLSVYDTVGAASVVDGHDGQQMSPELQEHFQLLLRNLAAYRPYLPDSLVGEKGEPGLNSSQVDVEAPLGEHGASVSICFTDVQSSTLLWESCPQGMFEGLHTHNNVLRSLLREVRGYEIKIIGDAFMAAFASAAQGAAFAIQGQKRLLEANWPSDLLAHELCRPYQTSAGLIWNGLRVRIGLHHGEVSAEKNPVTGRFDYFGPTVNTAARVESIMRHGGLTGMTKSALEAARATDAAVLNDTAITFLGLMELRGVRESVEIAIVLPAALSARTFLVHQTAPPVEVQPDGSRNRTSVVSMGIAASLPRSSTSSSSRVRLRSPDDDVSSLESNFYYLPGGNQIKISLRRSVVSVASVRALAPVREELGTALSDLLGVVQLAADVHQGEIVAVLSGTATIVWNGATSCADHVAQAGAFLERVRNVSDSCTIGGATGPAGSGTLPAARRCFATVVGGCVEMSVALAEEAELCGERVLVTGLLARLAASAGLAHRLQVWRAPGDVIVWAVARGETFTKLAHREHHDMYEDTTASISGPPCQAAQADAAFVAYAKGEVRVEVIQEIAAIGELSLQETLERLDQVRVRECPYLVEAPLDTGVLPEVPELDTPATPPLLTTG
eukprot:Hpha_TRINITY_DN8890_c0_g1::TRINITY_DN8890_c0_g1_i1::g.141672::m.141672